MTFEEKLKLRDYQYDKARGLCSKCFSDMTKVLFRYIDSQTKTVDLMDIFNEVDDNKKLIYRFLIQVNTEYVKIGDLYAHFYPVISHVRSDPQPGIGDITFTQFKNRNHFDELRAFYDKEITSKIAKEHEHGNGLAVFSQAYKLRAQSSSNRSGYGSEWWGEECVYEGTLYGETDDYWIIGAVIDDVTKPLFSF